MSLYIYNTAPYGKRKQVIFLLYSHLGFKLMPAHRPSCGCGFCAILGRTHFFATHPNRHPRFLEVAGIRLRLLYTQLVDLAEGFVPAFELPGQPSVADPIIQQGVGVPPGQVGEQPPAPAVAAAESGLVSCPKAKAASPGKREKETGEGEPAARGNLPKEGEKTIEKRKPHRSRQRGTSASRERHPEPAPAQSEERERPKKKRSRSSPRERRKSKRKSRSRSRRRRESRRGSSKRRPVTPERREDSYSRKRLTDVKQERGPSGERGAIAEASGPSRGEGRSRADRVEETREPHPPSEPPARWSGPIRAYPREERGSYWEGDPRDWPKSKGVKRREKNRAFREANYGQRWNYSHRGDHFSR